MNAPLLQPPALRHRLLAIGLLAALALTGCVPAGGGLAGGGLADGDGADGCGATASCEEPAQLEAQVRLDTYAILAGIAHARARMGMQEDAAP